MDVRLIIGIPAIIISIILSAVNIKFLIAKAKERPILRLCAVFHILAIIWSGTYLMEVLLSKTPGDRFIFKVFSYIGVTYACTAWLIFCLVFAGYEKKFGKKGLILLSAIPVVCYLMLVTNNFHHLFFKDIQLGYVEFGPLFWIHTIESYIYALAGTIILLRHIAMRQGSGKRNLIFTAAGLLAVGTANVLMLSPLTPPGFDLTCIGYSAAMVFMTLAVLKYKLLNVIPVAFRQTV